MKLIEAITKFYHASPKRLKFGSILTPGRGNKDKGWQHHAVFLTTKPLPHHSILKHAVKEDWHVYEVEPIGKIKRGIWDDVEVDSAEIIKYIGKARGIVGGYKKKSKFNKKTQSQKKHLKKTYPEDEWTDKDSEPYIGSRVNWDEYKKMKAKRNW